MATLFDIEFLSSDEDADYVVSEEDDDEVNKHKGRRGKRNNKQNQEKLKEEILKQKSKRIFEEMKKKDEESTVHTPLVKKDDLLLQFHKKHLKKSGKKNETIDELMKFLNVATSQVEKNSIEKFDVMEIKRKCRLEVNNLSEITENAMDEIENCGVVKVEKTIRFAGKTVTIEERMDRNSRKYHMHLKNETQKLGGKFEVIDKIVSTLEGTASINSVQKSEADWIKYREEAGIELELSKNRQDGFLEKQSFLAAAELREHNIQLEKKKKMMSNNSQNSSNSFK